MSAGQGAGGAPAGPVHADGAPPAGPAHADGGAPAGSSHADGGAPAGSSRPQGDPLPVVEPGRYRHYKGGEYELLGIARHSETLEALVVYRPLYGAGGLWVRPHAMFFEDVEVDGRRRPRFERV